MTPRACGPIRISAPDRSATAANDGQTGTMALSHFKRCAFRATRVRSTARDRQRLAQHAGLRPHMGPRTCLEAVRTVRHPFGTILAGAFVLVVPAVVLFLAFQRCFIAPNIGPAVKG